MINNHESNKSLSSEQSNIIPIKHIDFICKKTSPEH